METFTQTALTLVLTLAIIVPIAVTVYRTHRKIGDAPPIPLGHLLGRAGYGREHRHAHGHRYGPDTDRILDELLVLNRHDRDGTSA